MPQKKTLQLIKYFCSTHPNTTVTALMKLSYLADLISMKEQKKQISCFEYIRYSFGPYDSRIYSYVEELQTNEDIVASNQYSTTGDEYLTYNATTSLEQLHDEDFDLLSIEDLKIIKNLVSELSGYGAKMLTEMAYKTAPMRNLGATLGGTEGLNKKLNMLAN